MDQDEAGGGIVIPARVSSATSPIWPRLPAPILISLNPRPTNKPYQQLGADLSRWKRPMRESLAFQICGVVPTGAIRTTKQKHKPNNRPEGFRGRKGSP